MKNFLSSLFGGSVIVNYMNTDTSVPLFWRDSMLYRGLNFLFTMPLRFFSWVYKRIEKPLSTSLFFKLLQFIEKHLGAFLGFVVLLFAVIPDHRWYNANGVVLVLGSVLLFYMVKAINSANRIEAYNIDYMMVVFFIAIAIAGVSSIFPSESKNTLLFYGITFLFSSILILSIDSKNSLLWFLRILCFGVFLTALYGIYQWKVIGIAVNPSQTDLALAGDLGGRIYSTMGNPNVYGEMLVLFTPLIFVLVLGEKGIVRKGFWLITLMPIALALLKTGSRSSWVAFAFAVLVFVLLWDYRFLPVLAILGLIMLPFLPPTIYNRLFSIFNSNDTSLKYRQMILGPALVMLRDFWVTGVGLGARTVGLIYQRYKGFGLTTVAHTHNFFIQLWLEAGIAALLALLAFVFRLFKNTFSAIRLKKDRFVGNVAIASISGILGLLLMGMADHIWFYNRILFFFWINAALVLSSIRLIQEEIR